MNKYEVLGVVGEGAYGVVLRCKNKENGEIVAIKKFKESEDDESVRKTTLREVKILRMLKQSNIIGLKEAFRRKGKLYLVFEYMEKNLLQVLEEHANGLDHELVRLYTYQLVKAIDYCHQNGVIHRDIKPENLLVNSSHILKLCDFGFARTLSKTGHDYTDYVATRWYRAPELLLGSSSYDKSVDIWVIGCIMAELFDGQALFPGESELDQLYLIQKTLGPLTSFQIEMFLRNPRFFGFKFPDMTKHEGLDKKFSTKINKKALSFMKAVLQIDPNMRLTGSQCLNHPYFEGLYEAERRPSANPTKRPDIVSKDSLANNPNAVQTSMQSESRLSAQRYRNNTTFKKSSYESGFPYPGNAQQMAAQAPPNVGSGLSSYPSLSALSEKKGSKKTSKPMPYDDDSEGSVPANGFRSSKEYIDQDSGDPRMKGFDGVSREKPWKSDFESREDKEAVDREIPDEQVKLRELMALQEQRGASRVGHRDTVLDPLPSLRSYGNIHDASAEDYGSEDITRSKRDAKKIGIQPLQHHTQHQAESKAAASRTKKSGLVNLGGSSLTSHPSTSNTPFVVPSNLENTGLADLSLRSKKQSKEEDTSQRKKEQVPRLSLESTPKEPISMEELYDLRDGRQFSTSTTQAATNGKKRRQQMRNENSNELGGSRPSTRGDLSGALDGLGGVGDANHRYSQRPQYDADGETRPTSRSDTASEARLEPVIGNQGNTIANRRSGPNW